MSGQTMAGVGVKLGPVGGSPAPPVGTSGEIGVVVVNLCDVMRRLDHLAEGIASRLTSVTVPSSPRTEDVPNRRTYYTDLGNHLNEQVIFAGCIADRLESLIDRISL